MNPQDYHSPHYNGFPLSPATSSSETTTVTQTMADDSFLNDYNLDSATYQQPFGLVTPFEPYTDATQPTYPSVWATSQQPAKGIPQQVQSSAPNLPTLVPQLNVARSMISDEGDDASEPTSPRDAVSERRKERRRAQNRAAQRAFRARKEDTIKESSARLEALQDELVRLQSAYGNLVTNLESQIAKLTHENHLLKERHASEISRWTSSVLDDDAAAAYSSTMGSSGRPSLEIADRAGLGMALDVGGASVFGTVRWEDSGGTAAAAAVAAQGSGCKSLPGDDKMVAGVLDAVADALAPRHLIGDHMQQRQHQPHQQRR